MLLWYLNITFSLYFLHRLWILWRVSGHCQHCVRYFEELEWEMYIFVCFFQFCAIFAHGNKKYNYMWLKAFLAYALRKHIYFHRILSISQISSRFLVLKNVCWAVMSVSLCSNTGLTIMSASCFIITRPELTHLQTLSSTRTFQGSQKSLRNLRNFKELDPKKKKVSGWFDWF